MIEKIVITNLPSFYKINLYNEINRRCPLLVIFTGDHAQGRNKDFYHGRIEFKHIFLRSNSILRIFQLLGVLRKHKHRELILSGWDSLPLWVAALCSPKRRNAVVVESSYHESTTSGLKGFIKRRFIGRVSKVYASGRAQRKITDNLGFKGNTIITKGVGVFNYIAQPAYVPRTEVRNFLYVGRLIGVKNLEYLIDKFNCHPELRLQIIGFGELEERLKQMANDNIEFLGAVDNKELSSYYQACDVLVLPSISEAWGLVVEEALNNGIPVMVSDKVGCAEEIVTAERGVVFTLSPDSFEEQLRKICNIETYNNMRQAIASMDFEAIAQHQVDCYL